MEKIEKGFVTALGTPLDPDGNLMVESYRKQINDQIDAGASALLCMGTMGIEPYIREDVYPVVAETAVSVAAGRVPVLIGAADTSVARIKKKIKAIEHLDFYALVFTPSFYLACNHQETVNFYRKISSLTDRQIFLYDHPYSTQVKITYGMIKELLGCMPNLSGIKSNDTVMFRKLMQDAEIPKSFEIVYSGLDIFDVGYKYGMDKCLDGMLACTPKNTGKLFTSLANNDYDSANIYLNNIISLRDLFVANDLWPCFTASMNMLGYEGNFAPDYSLDITKKAYDAVYAEMKRIEEI